MRQNSPSTDSEKLDTRSPLAFNARGEEIFALRKLNLHKRIDNVFATLMPFQWVFAIICSIFISPKSWEGFISNTHTHVWTAVCLGGAITLLPMYFVHTARGQVLTRHVIAASQVLMSGLLVHLTGGRIETHFHVFGSLALLAFYRDWTVLVTATLIVMLNHTVLGLYFPMSVYGTQTPSSWRWLEHSGWVVFEDAFLIYSCVTTKRNLKDLCYRQGQLETLNSKIESEVELRTHQLADTHQELDVQRSKAMESARLAALGEMAGGVAHEINNPLAVINARARHIQKLLTDPSPNLKSALDFAKTIELTSNRIAAIVTGLRTFSRTGETDPFEECNVRKILSDVMDLSAERLKSHGIEVRFIESQGLNASFYGRSVQIAQVLVNLLNNAHDAIEELNER